MIILSINVYVGPIKSMTKSLVVDAPCQVKFFMVLSASARLMLTYLRVNVCSAGRTHHPISTKPRASVTPITILHHLESVCSFPIVQDNQFGTQMPINAPVYLPVLPWALTAAFVQPTKYTPQSQAPASAIRSHMLLKQTLC